VRLVLHKERPPCEPGASFSSTVQANAVGVAAPFRVEPNPVTKQGYGNGGYA
jgi:hypothetical protein